MTGRGSATIIILIVLILLSLSLAGGIFYFFRTEQIKTLGLEAKLQELDAKQRLTQARLGEAEKLVADLQLKLGEANSQISTLTNDLQAERTAKQEALNSQQQLSLDLEQQKALRSDLESQLNAAQEQLKNIQAQLQDLESQKTALQEQKAALEAKVSELEKSSQDVELGRIVVSPEGSMVEPREQASTGKTENNPPATGLQGKVLVINKDYSFAVINLGSKDGVEIGQVFGVYHNNKYVGDVKVEKIHDSMAAAGFGTPDLRDKIGEGDKVVQKVK